jgi:hypothetical protein
MNISCSARKDWQYHIRDWIDFERAHAKIHGDLQFDYSDIDYAFGFVEELSPLYGGRESSELAVTRVDTYWLYDNGIGLKIPLSSKMFNDNMYNNSKQLLNAYHREGNAIIVSTNKLAERIKEDFPKYKIEASAIMDITSNKHLKVVADTNLYDNIVLPICANDDVEFLESIENKDQIRLFINAECSYNCPKKVCYGSNSKVNSNTRNEMLCSHWDLKLPRTWYDNTIDWGNFYFDVNKFNDIGFNNYKILPSWESQQRINIMTDIQYENN